jgi:hypothetical protein
MRKTLFCVLALVGLVAVFLAVRPAGAYEELDPLKVAPDTHKLLFENQFVRVIQAKVPAGGVEPKHSHPKGITVYLADYSIEQKSLPDGKVSRADRKSGTVTWSDAVVHEIKNTGKTPSHAIRIELKR